MKVFIPRETDPEETRIPLLPVDSGKMVELGAQVEVEAGIGEPINILDSAYEESGAKVSNDRRASLSAADIVLRISVPTTEDIQHLKQGCIHVSHMDPFNKFDIIKELSSKKVSAISLEMIPRTTIAQKMDVMSSQANLAGYVAVILAARRQQKIFPMMMTPSGTISPVRVFVIGAGVAGLQAIATASQMFSSNLYNFLEHFWDKEAKSFTLDRDNEIIQRSLITYQGQIVNASINEAFK